jgi:hypothetical protein
MKGAIDLDPFIAWLRSFAARFPEGTAAGRENRELKVAHSLRVAREAEDIVSRLEAPERILRLAPTAALLHDVGRFPQYSRYRTFKDKISVNHALLGFRTLRREPVLDALPTEDRLLVLRCVLMHNRARLPLRLPRDLGTALRVVRDADKLDIVTVVLPHLDGSNEAGNETVTLGLRDNPDRYSGPVLRSVLEGCSVSYGDMTYRNDFRLLLAGWVYDLNFAPTRDLFLQRGHLRAIMAGLPDTQEIRDLENTLHAFLLRASSE